MRSCAELTELFRERGLRVTPQRQAIFGLLEGEGSHPTVEALYERARDRMPTISRKTVYQTVHDLEALGEVRILDLGTGAVRVDPHVEDHDHCVCTRCGHVFDVAADHELHLPVRYRSEFSVDVVEVIYRGRCDTCSRSNH